MACPLAFVEYRTRPGHTAASAIATRLVFRSARRRARTYTAGTIDIPATNAGSRMAAGEVPNRYVDRRTSSVWKKWLFGSL